MLINLQKSTEYLKKSAKSIYKTKLQTNYKTKRTTNPIERESMILTLTLKNCTEVRNWQHSRENARSRSISNNEKL